MAQEGQLARDGCSGGPATGHANVSVKSGRGIGAMNIH